MSILKEKVLQIPELQLISPTTMANVQLLIDQFENDYASQLNYEEEGAQKYQKQFLNLFKKLANSGYYALLKDVNHRALLNAFVKCQSVEHYKYSYFNNAKLTKLHIQRMKQVGPILFSQAILIASKINLINKNSSRLFIEDHLYAQSQSPTTIKIQQILKLCDEKKRSINNNLKKLQLILQGPDYFETIKQLGKMLRDSWKKDKSKTKIQDVVKMSFKNTTEYTKKNHIEQEYFEQNSQYVKKYEQFDRLSFTSSQKQIIRQDIQKAHDNMNYSFFMEEFEEQNSDFKVKQQLFPKNQPLYPSPFI